MVACALSLPTRIRHQKFPLIFSHIGLIYAETIIAMASARPAWPALIPTTKINS